MTYDLKNLDPNTKRSLKETFICFNTDTHFLCLDLVLQR